MVYFVVGPSGVGKTIFSKMVNKKYEIPVYDTGPILRNIYTNLKLKISFQEWINLNESIYGDNFAISMICDNIKKLLKSKKETIVIGNRCIEGINYFINYFNLNDYKIIYLDGDIVVRKDLSDFYAIDLGDNYLAGVPSLDLVFSEETKLVNAGILLFDAKKMRDNNMRDILVEKRRSLGDSGSMDQKTFNLVMKDQIGYLPYEYNCIPGKIMGAERGTYTIEKLNDLYNTSFESSKDLVENAAIWHYATGDKPWKYSFIYGADEWYENYLASPYGSEKLDRKSAFRAHAEGVINHLKNGGVKSVVNRLVDYIKTLTGKAENKTWG